MGEVVVLDRIGHGLAQHPLLLDGGLLGWQMGEGTYRKLSAFSASLHMDSTAFWPQSSFLSFPRLIFYAAAESRLGKQNESFKQICTWIKERVIFLVQSTDQFEEKAICFFTFWVRTVCFFPFKGNKDREKLIKRLEPAGYNSYRIFKCA